MKLADKYWEFIEWAIKDDETFLSLLGKAMLLGFVMFLLAVLISFLLFLGK